MNCDGLQFIPGDDVLEGPLTNRKATGAGTEILLQCAKQYTEKSQIASDSARAAYAGQHKHSGHPGNSYNNIYYFNMLHVTCSAIMLAALAPDLTPRTE
jgi:hypothetical protein